MTDEGGRMKKDLARQIPPTDRLRDVSFLVLPSLFSRFFLLCAFVLFCGCAGYQIGNRTLYPPDIRTVYVPMFESNSYRRNLGERLTEAVMKEIELKTPYKVVNTPNADSVLTGKLVSDAKTLLVESPTDEARLSEIRFEVQVTWVDRRGEFIQQGVVPIAPAVADIVSTGKFAPEVGQSVTSAQDQAFKRMAEQIVGLMEAPW